MVIVRLNPTVMAACTSHTPGAGTPEMRHHEGLVGSRPDQPVSTAIWLYHIIYHCVRSEIISI